MNLLVGCEDSNNQPRTPAPDLELEQIRRTRELLKPVVTMLHMKMYRDQEDFSVGDGIF